MRSIRMLGPITRLYIQIDVRVVLDMKGAYKSMSSE